MDVGLFAVCLKNLWMGDVFSDSMQRLRLGSFVHATFLTFYSSIITPYNLPAGIQSQLESKAQCSAADFRLQLTLVFPVILCECRMVHWTVTFRHSKI